MELLESVEEARYMVQESTRETNLEDIGNTMNPTFEQDQAESFIEGMADHLEYMHLDVDGITEMDNGRQSTSIFKDITVPNKTELMKETKRLDEFKWKY